MSKEYQMIVVSTVVIILHAVLNVSILSGQINEQNSRIEKLIREQARDIQIEQIKNRCECSNH